MISNLKSFMQKFTGGSNNTITVNGRSFKGSSLSIVNGTIVIDGKKVLEPVEKEIIVTITGDVKDLYLDSGKITMEGDVGRLEVNHGKVEMTGDVKENVSVKHGNLSCDNIYSDVEVNHGNVRAVTIHGATSVKMGNITR